MEKSDLFTVHVTRPLPCWVRSHGRSKLPNKNIIFGVGEERHEVLLGSPLPCLVSFLFFYFLFFNF